MWKMWLDTVEMHHVRKLSDLNPKLSEIDRIMATEESKSHYVDYVIWIDINRTPSREKRDYKKKTQGNKSPSKYPNSTKHLKAV